MHTPKIPLLLGALLGLAATPAPAATPTVAAPADPPAPRVLELSRPFATRAPWRFTVTQTPDVADPFGEPGDTVPGPVRLCLSRDAGRSCPPMPALDDLLRVPPMAGLPADDMFVTPYEVTDLRVVRPRPGRPLLWLQVASTHSGDGDQRVAALALAYDPRRDAFVPVYRQQTNRNNNQEIRYLDAGPLRGDVVFATPTLNAPFGFWLTVSAPGAAPTDPYRVVLRTRSHTRYNDGNPLAVIDSEMPDLQRRLGVWRPGQPLPLPAHGACARPHLVRGALWC